MLLSPFWSFLWSGLLGDLQPTSFWSRWCLHLFVSEPLERRPFGALAPWPDLRSMWPTGSRDDAYYRRNDWPLQEIWWSFTSKILPKFLTIGEFLSVTFAFWISHLFWIRNEINYSDVANGSESTGLSSRSLGLSLAVTGFSLAAGDRFPSASVCFLDGPEPVLLLLFGVTRPLPEPPASSYSDYLPSATPLLMRKETPPSASPWSKFRSSADIYSSECIKIDIWIEQILLKLYEQSKIKNSSL